MYIGIDLGGTNIKAGVVDENGTIIYKDSCPTGAGRPSNDILKDMADLAVDTVKKAGLTMDDIQSVGVGSPGSVDEENGVLIRAENLNFDHVPICAKISEYTGKKTYLGNDANVAALAEYYAQGKEMECFIAVTLGTGVGGGIVINGKLYTGFNGAAAEVGHMVTHAGGHRCNCGRSGCWEAYASVSALIRQTKASLAEDSTSLMYQAVDGDLSKVGGKTAFDAAKQGDAAAQKVVQTYLENVGIGIANLINVFQPDMIVIGGAISKEGDYLLNPVKEFCAKEAFTQSGKVTELKIAGLGNDAGLIGAAFLGK